MGTKEYSMNLYLLETLTVYEAWVVAAESEEDIFTFVSESVKVSLLATTNLPKGIILTKSSVASIIRKFLYGKTDDSFGL